MTPTSAIARRSRARKRLESLEVPAVRGEGVQRGAPLDLEAAEVLVDQRRGFGDDSRGPPLRGRPEPSAHRSHPEWEAQKATAPALADASDPGHDRGVPCEVQEHERVYHRRRALGKDQRRACSMPRSARSSGARIAAAIATYTATPPDQRQHHPREPEHDRLREHRQEPLHPGAPERERGGGHERAAQRAPRSPTRAARRAGGGAASRARSR